MVMVMTRMKIMAMNKVVPMCYSPIDSNPIPHLINLWGRCCHKYCVCDMHPVHRTEAQTPALSLSCNAMRETWASAKQPQFLVYRMEMIHRTVLLKKGPSLQCLTSKKFTADVRSSPHSQFFLFICGYKNHHLILLSSRDTTTENCPQIVLIFICKNVCENCSHRE